jgi:hypothetical protein
MQQILSAGHDVDFIDAEAIQRVGIPYPVLVMPHVERLSPETLKSIAAYVAGGGKVIAVGSAPSKSPGFRDAAEVAAQVQRLSHALFANAERAKIVAQDADLGAALQQAVKPDMQLSDGSAEIGFLHRKLNDADIYFIANTSNRAIETSASFRGARPYAATLDTSSGASYAIDPKTIALNLAPYESRVIFFSGTPIGQPDTAAAGAPHLIEDLTHDWKVKFAGTSIERTEQTPTSWSDDPRTRFYSGVATYTRTIRLSASELKDAHSIVLDFGEGTPVAADPKIRSGMRALVDGPIRDAAVVTINGHRVGSVWHPPYRLDVTTQLHAGDNTVEIEVANTAINELAGRAPADYHLLNARYGERFTPQDMNDLQPLPSGMLGPIHLLEMK